MATKGNLGNRGGGRTKDPIWAKFNTVEVTDSKGKCEVKNVECSMCNKKVSAKPLRMKNHWEKCAKRKCQRQNVVNIDTETSDSDENLLPSPKRLISKSKQSSNAIDSESVDIDTTNETSLSSLSSATSSSVTRTVQQKIKHSVIITTKAEKEKLDVVIAKFFYSCNISFNTAENPHFKKMIETLRPGYPSPNRKELAGGLLNKVYDECELEMKDYLKGKTLTLMQDGWSNVHNNPVIANCVSDGVKSFFINSIETSTNHKDAAYCLDLAIEAIRHCETKYSCKINSFVSDNENKMKKMRSALQTARNDHDPNNSFISYGCAAHYMNLLGQDICQIKNIASILSQIVEVSKYFRNHHVPKGYLNNFKEALEPQLPGDTRWNSQLTCVQVFLKNREFYCKICTEHSDEVEDRITTIASNVGLYVEAKNLHRQLLLIGNALNKLQSESANIADATNEFLLLMESEDLMPYKTQVSKRFSDCITQYHKLAYMLSPKYQGSKLKPEEKEEIRNFVKQKLNEKFIPFMLHFELQSSPFPKTMFSDSVLKSLSPSQWWKVLKNQCLTEKLNDDDKNVLVNFLDFSEHLQRCVASSASIERTFSNFGFIQSKTRNRLGMNTVSKLVSVYRMLNVKTANQQDVLQFE